MKREPESELTDAQAEELRAALLTLEAELSAAVAGSEGAAATVELDEPIGRLSRMDAIQQQKMAEASREGLALRARQARAALSRLAEGRYGECMGCEEPVGYARLRARPEAPFCIACQSSREQR